MRTQPVSFVRSELSPSLWLGVDPKSVLRQVSPRTVLTVGHICMLLASNAVAISALQSVKSSTANWQLSTQTGVGSSLSPIVVRLSSWTPVEGLPCLVFSSTFLHFSRGLGIIMLPPGSGLRFHGPVCRADFWTRSFSRRWPGVWLSAALASHTLTSTTLGRTGRALLP